MKPSVIFGSVDSTEPPIGTVVITDRMYGSGDSAHSGRERVLYIRGDGLGSRWHRTRQLTIEGWWTWEELADFLPMTVPTRPASTLKAGDECFVKETAKVLQGQRVVVGETPSAYIPWVRVSLKDYRDPRSVPRTFHFRHEDLEPVVETRMEDDAMKVGDYVLTVNTHSNLFGRELRISAITANGHIRAYCKDGGGWFASRELTPSPGPVADSILTDREVLDSCYDMLAHAYQTPKPSGQTCNLIGHRVYRVIGGVRFAGTIVGIRMGNRVVVAEDDSTWDEPNVVVPLSALTFFTQPGGSDE